MMLMRTDPFRDLDRWTQQVLGTAARPAAYGQASCSCNGGCTRGRTISARPRAVKPSRRGRSGSFANAACRAGASEPRRRAGRRLGPRKAHARDRRRAVRVWHDSHFQRCFNGPLGIL